MVGLNSTLSIATGALAAQTAGLEITNNNIANANTPGYVRQVVSLSSSANVQKGASVDAGVFCNGYQSVRDTVLQLAINAATSDEASLTAQSATLSQVDSAFSGTTTGIGASISTLFSSLSSLSANPADPLARQAALADASQLANSFHQGAAALNNATNSANQQVTSTVAQINHCLGQIAGLNGQLASLTAGEDGGALEDQRDALVTELAGLVGVSSIQTGASPTLTTTNGSPLVMGAATSPLQVKTAPDGNVHVLDAQGRDITNDLTGGALGGAIAARDTALPALANQLNTLASQFTDAMNGAQAAGFDLSGSSGQPMFALPSDPSSAAAGISVALTDASGIAASSDGTGGSSGNVQNLLAVQTNLLPSGAAPGDAYAAFVANVGTTGSQMSSDLTAASTVLQQLTTQQGSESGVSIDEETANLIRYQQAYSAAARVISTINDMYSVLMNISVGGA